MNKLKGILSKSILLVLLLLVPAGMFPCSTIVLTSDTHNAVGQNFDWTGGDAHVSVNYANVLKRTFPVVPVKEMSWVSKYGSITFNQAGKEFAFGGMNEAGLVITQMMLSESVYPEEDERFSLSETQWVQYQLDNFATVDEVIASKGSVRPSLHSIAKLHFMVSDNKGDRAIIESINGAMKIYRDSTLPYPVLTNDTYQNSLAYIRQFIDKDGFKPLDQLPQGIYSLPRFTRAAALASDWKGAEDQRNPLKYASEILDNLSMPPYTQWSIVYDTDEKKIYYKTNNNQEVRELCLSSFDFLAPGPGLYIDVDAPHSGSPEEFTHYNWYDNRDLIERVCESIEFYKGITPRLRERIARYPESTVNLN